MVLDSAHLNSLSAPRISGVIRRYRGACSAKIQPVSRWVTPLKRNLRTGRVIFYDTFKSILRISTSCEGNEIHAELIAFVPCCFEPNDENNDTVLVETENICPIFENSHVRMVVKMKTCNDWTTEKLTRDLTIWKCKWLQSRQLCDWRSNNDWKRLIEFENSRNSTFKDSKI